jgi:hypothetical protein
MHTHASDAHTVMFRTNLEGVCPFIILLLGANWPSSLRTYPKSVFCFLSKADPGPKEQASCGTSNILT